MKSTRSLNPLIVLILLSGLLPTLATAQPPSPSTPAVSLGERTARTNPFIPPPAAPFSTSQEPGGGIQSLSGSYVEFDDGSQGYDTCYITGTSQTFCFLAESYTDDWEWVRNLWIRFPSDWTVTNVWDDGPNICDQGGNWGTFSWSHHAGHVYEINIDQSRNHANPVDHCYTYYCFDVTVGSGAPNALESWYWDGDGYGSSPHNPCSDDGYTPSGQTVCDEAIEPQAAIPPCQTGLFVAPESVQAEGCSGVGHTQTFTLSNYTGSNGTFDLSYHASPNASAAGPTSISLDVGQIQTFDVVLSDHCQPNGSQVTTTIHASGNGYSDTAFLAKAVNDVSGWVSVPGSVPAWAGNGYPSDGCTAQDAAGDWVTYLIGDQLGIVGFWGYNHATNTWFDPVATNTPPDRWAPDWAYDPETNLCYLTGGANAPGPATYDEAYVYDPAANAFNSLPDFDTARNWHDSWVGQIDGTKYLCLGGGVNGSGSSIASTQCYDVLSGTWQPQNSVMDPYPVPIWAAADGVRRSAGGDQFWVVAGTQNDSASDRARYFDDVDNNWHTAGNTGQIRYRVEGDFRGNDFYQIGGTADGAIPSPTVVRGRLDGANWVWQQLEDLPHARLDNVVGVTVPPLGDVPAAIWSLDGYGDSDAAYVDYLLQCPACPLDWSKRAAGQAWSPGLSVTAETSDTLQIVDTVATFRAFDLDDNWDPDRLALLAYQANAGNVNAGADTLAWSVPAGAPENAVLTKTFQVQACTWTQTLLGSQLTPESSPSQERSIQVEKRPPDLWLSIPPDLAVYAGQPVTFSLSYGNRGGYENDVWVWGQFPPQAPFLSADPAPTQLDPAGLWARWDVGGLADGQTGDIAVSVAVSTSLTPSDTLSSRSILYDHVDQPWDSSGISLTVQTPQLYFSKAVTPLSQYLGEPATYTLSYGSNAGSAPGALVSDTLPDQVVFARADPPGTYDPASHTLSWPPVDLTPGDALRTTIVVTLSQAITSGVWLTNTAHLNQAYVEPLTDQAGHYAQARACQTITEVTLTRVTTGTLYPGNPVEWLADLAPDDAAKPYTYTLDYGDGTVISGSASADPLPLNHAFPTTGTFRLTVGAWNCAMTQPVTTSEPITVYEPDTCLNLTHVTIQGETGGLPGTYTFTTAYQPHDATMPITYLWDDGGTDATSVRTFQVGSHSLTVTATNCPSPPASVTDTHTVRVTAPDVQVSPPGAIPPLFPGQTHTQTLTLANTGGATLTWSLTETPAVAWLTESSLGGDLAPLSETDVFLLVDAAGLAPDTYTTSLQLQSNDPDDGLVSVPLTLTVAAQPVCTPVTGVDLSPLFTGTIHPGDAVGFSADLAPDDAVKPYTYTIYLEGSTLVYPQADQTDPLTFSHTFPTTGSYRVTFLAWNCTMTTPAGDAVEIEVEARRVEPDYTIYLPIVLRN